MSFGGVLFMIPKKPTSLKHIFLDEVLVSVGKQIAARFRNISISNLNFCLHRVLGGNLIELTSN